jgi:hypothetical protein
MKQQILNKKIIVGISLLAFFALFYFFFFKSSEAQVCLPLSGYLVWPGTWESGWVPMASTTQYVLTRSPIYVSGSNVGIGTRSPVYTFQVNGDISGTRLCIGSDCRSVWPVGGITGSGSSGQVTFWTGATSIGGDNNLFWDNTNKRLGIGTTTPQTSLHVIGNITANTFLGTINAANVSSGQFGANTGGGNYSFPGNVGIGTASPSYKLDIVGDVRWSGTLQGGSVPWARLTSFPSGCPSGQFVTAVGSSLTCALPPSGGVSGSGTTNYLAKWTGSTTLGNSIIYDNGNVGIGTTNPLSKLSIGTSGNSSYAVYVNTGSIYGMYVYGSSIAISGYGGPTGVYGEGSNHGVYGRGGAWGVYGTVSGSGTGATVGVGGVGGTYGVYGTGTTYSVYAEGGIYSVYATGGTYGVVGIGSNTGIYGSSSSGYGIYGSSSSGYDFYGAGPRSYFAGNVGIGTTNPVAKLDVYDNSTAGYGEKLALRRTGAGDVGLSFQQNGVTAFGIVHRSGGGLAFVDNYWEGSPGTERMRITSAGNVGIGTTAPDYKLRVEGTVAAYSWVTLSDISLKKDIQPLNYGILDKVLKLNPVSFYWKDENMDKEKHFGFIAQEVEEVLPELVRQDSQGKKILNYNELVPYLVRAIQEQQKEIEELKAQIQNSKH